MTRWLTIAFLLGGVVACDDDTANGTPGPVDETALDAQRADTAVEDAAQPRTDARVADAAIDQGLDATTDAQADAALTREEFVRRWLASCEGTPPPPINVSENGEEVCNYVDDDGDGLVDEGFDYVPLGEPVQVMPEPILEMGRWQVHWNGQHYAFSWRDWGGDSLSGGYTDQFRLLLLDERLCPVAEPTVVPSHAGFDIWDGQVATASGRFLVLFQEIPRQEPGLAGRAYYQLIDSDGSPLGDVQEFVPGHVHGPFNAVADVDGNFALFSSTTEGGIYSLVSPDGEVLTPPWVVTNPAVSHRYGYGLAFDGAGIAVVAAEGQRGGLWFTRWALDGEVLVPTRVLGPGRLGSSSDRAGLVWTDSHFAVYANDRLARWDHLFLVAVDGTISDDGDVELHPQDDIGGGFFQVVRQGEQLLVYGTSAAPRSAIPGDRIGKSHLHRFSLDGRLVALSPPISGRVAAQPGKPLLWLGVEATQDPDFSVVLAQFYGCARGGRLK